MPAFKPYSWLEPAIKDWQTSIEQQVSDAVDAVDYDEALDYIWGQELQKSGHLICLDVTPILQLLDCFKIYDRLHIIDDRCYVVKSLSEFWEISCEGVQ